MMLDTLALLCTVPATFLLTILILSFTLGAPSVRTIRHNRETAVDKLKQQESSFGDTSDTWTCPCRSQVSYSDFMTIYLTQSPNDPGMLLQIDDISYYNAEQNENDLRFSTCQTLTDPTCGRYRNITSNFHSSVGCETVLFSTMTKRGTVIPFNCVSKANLVWQAAASQAQVALLAAIPYRLQWDYGEGIFRNQWLCLEDLLTVMSFAWNLVAESDAAMPEAAAFWNQSRARTSGALPYDAVWSFEPYNPGLDGALQTLLNGSGPINPGDAGARLIDVQYQPVMPVVHFNWSAFIDACDVPYCDVTQRSPFWYRAFTAFSQIGGYTTVAVVTLRVVLWPLCTWLLLPKSMPKTASSTVASSLPTTTSGLFAGPYSNFAVPRTGP